MLEVRREPIIGNFPKGMIHDAYITPDEAVRRFDVGKVEVVKGISVSGFLRMLFYMTVRGLVVAGRR